MVLGWRRAFCTSIPRDQALKGPKEKQEHINSNSNPSPRLSSKFGFFSNPSTPRLQSQPVSSPSLRCRTVSTATVASPSVPESPKLQCKTKNSPKFFQRSNPSSPRSPSTFSLLKSSLRLSKNRCGICLHSVKAGQGMAIFTAECSHCFHFPCIATHVNKQGILICPVCGSNWKELPVLTTNSNYKPENAERKQDLKNQAKQFPKSVLKIYNDDEPLMSPTSVARFNPIPELDENEDEDHENRNGDEEFQGFFVKPIASPIKQPSLNCRNVEVMLSPEAAVVSVGRTYETYVVVLKVRAPAAPSKNSCRVPIDLVTLLDVSGGLNREKMQMMKRAMRLVVSSLSSADRLSIVAFGAISKRLLPLRRMTPNGRLSARRIIDALVSCQGTSSGGDVLKKAAKVLEDRRERNPATSIIFLSDGATSKNSGKLFHQEIPVHSIGFDQAYSNDAFTKCIGGLLSVVVQDLRLQLGFISGSAPAEIAAVYSCSGRPTAIGSGAIRMGNLYAEEERELLIELKVPSSCSSRAHHVLSVRCSSKDHSSQDLFYGNEQALLVPRPHTIRSSSPSIERLRCLFFTTRAVAESRRLIERSDLTGAHNLLSSTRTLLLRSKSASADMFIRGLETQLSELHGRGVKQSEEVPRRRTERGSPANLVDEKGELLTPMSAWRAAERLAKVAIMRKSMNRVSDLHGLEDARFFFPFFLLLLSLLLWFEKIN